MRQVPSGEAQWCLLQLLLLLLLLTSLLPMM
jgi:hypothetical protein